jgi:hypothetical protein
MFLQMKIGGSFDQHGSYFFFGHVFYEDLSFALCGLNLFL